MIIFFFIYLIIGIKNLHKEERFKPEPSAVEKLHLIGGDHDRALLQVKTPKQVDIYLIIGMSDEHKEERFKPEPSAVEKLPHIGGGHDVVRKIKALSKSS